MVDDDPTGRLNRLAELASFKNAALLGLALLFVVIAILALTGSSSSAAGGSQASSNYAAALFGVVLICAIFAWLNPDNTSLLGNGIRHLLSINRAAVGSFVLACAAIVLILLYVVLTAANSQDLRHGLYLLAAVEFLLKLAAVSAIIVLITMRRTPVLAAQQTNPTTPINPPDPAVPASPVILVDERENGGQLEFGGVAFAFGLVVIAGLVIPNEDLMRLSALFFGGERKVEDYLPRQPILTVEDDLADRIVMNVSHSQIAASIFANLTVTERDSLQNAIHRAAEFAAYDSAIENARRTGTLPILESICAGTHADIIFANSTNTTLSDHLNYLVSEGLVSISYDDLTSMQVTDYGNDVMFKHASTNCFGHEETQETAQDTTRTLQASTATPISIDGTFRSFRLELAEGSYHATLIAMDGSDPILQLTDSTGMVLQQDDDSGPGFNSLLYFTVNTENQGLLLRARNYGQSQGNAMLYLRPANEDLPFDPETNGFANAAFPESSAEQLALEDVMTEIPEDGHLAGLEVTETGVAVGFTGPSDGIYQILFENDADSETLDLTATLFERTESGLEQMAYDDDGGDNGLPLIRTSLEANGDYILVVEYYDVSEAGDVPAAISITAERQTGLEEDDQPAGEGDELSPATPPDSLPPPA